MSKTQHQMDRFTLQHTVAILIGSAIYAFSLHVFIIPNGLMEGGLTGISLLLLYVAGIPPSATTLLLNLPLFYVGWRQLGKHAMSYTIIGTFALALFLWIMERLLAANIVQPFRSQDDMLLASLYAGVFLGSGLGIVFRFGGTTGGTDIIARLGNKWRGWSMGHVLLVIDAIVISSSLLYIPLQQVLYTLVVVFIATRVINFIQDGAYATKAFLIITDHPTLVCKSIEAHLQHSATLLQAKGAHMRKSKEIVYCVVNKHESRKMKTIVKTIDPLAFIIISDVHEVLGEGFQPHAP